MARPQKIGTFTIAVGTADSNELTLDDFGRCRSLVIIADGTALTGTVTLETGNQGPGNIANTNFATVQSPPGTDVAIAADKAVPITALPFPRLRLHSSVNQAGSPAVFEVWGEVGE